MDAEPIEKSGDEPDDQDPPPLTNDKEQRSIDADINDVDNDDDDDDADDGFNSLYAPIDEAPISGEFRLSIEMPPPVVIAEARRMSRRSIGRISIQSDRIPKGETEWNAREREINASLDQEDVVEIDNKTMQEQEIDNPMIDKENGGNAIMEENETGSKSKTVQQIEENPMPDGEQEGVNADDDITSPLSQEENDDDRIESSSQEQDTSGTLAICESNCQPSHITLGEPEKEQLKAAGLHILQIGEQLLKEMSFIENLMSKFGYSVPNKSRKSDQSSGKEQEDDQSSDKRQDGKSKKSQIIDSIAAQAKRLCGLEEESNEESKNSAKAARFGSGFESPHFSLTSVPIQGTSQSREPYAVDDVTPPQNVNQNSNPELRKRLAELEIQMNGMNSKLESCDKQIKQVYVTLCGALNKLSEETAFLREQISGESEQGTMLRTSMEDKIAGFEQQIMKLAKVIWEMKCETKAQMHFGRLE